MATDYDAYNELMESYVEVAEFCLKQLIDIELKKDIHKVIKARQRTVCDMMVAEITASTYVVKQNKTPRLWERIYGQSHSVQTSCSHPVGGCDEL